MNRLNLLRKGLSAIAGCCLSITVLGQPADPTWVQQAYLKASNTGSKDAFGWAVAASGDTIVVGAYEEDSTATGINGDQSDNLASFAGAAYVYVRHGATWVQQAYLKASNTGGPSSPDDEFGDGFGWAVAISGNTIVVGAPQEDSSAAGVNGDQDDNQLLTAGAAYVFVREGTNWTQQAYLKASNPGPDIFGISVAISGDTIVVGALDEASSATGVDGDQTDDSTKWAGAAYVFARQGTNWTQQAYLKASNTPPGPSGQLSVERFGIAVAISGDTIVVGAADEDSDAQGVDGDQTNDNAVSAGAAYVFTRAGAVWSQQAYLKASNTEANDQFGWSVAISGDTIVVGARGEDSNGRGVNGEQGNNALPDSGAAYVFARKGATWMQQAYLKASNTGAGDRFGASVAIAGDAILVGAAGFDYINGVGGSAEDSSATGVNGDQANNSASNSGAAYLFIRDGTAWKQTAYLKASNTGANDYFGRAVALDTGVLVIGAPDEASRATGVNGDQTDNSSAGSGAAYAFGYANSAPKLTLLPDGSGGYFLRVTGSSTQPSELQRADSALGPWKALATLAPSATGLAEFHEVSPNQNSAFYRVVVQ